MMFYPISLLIVVHFTRIQCFVQQNSPNMRGGGNIFESFLQSLGMAPTAAPYLDPLSNNYGQGNAFGGIGAGTGMFPLMMADIDIADRVSAMADARAGKRESMQGRQVRPGGREQPMARERQQRFNRRNMGPQRPSSSWHQQQPATNKSPSWSNMYKDSLQQLSRNNKQPSEWNTPKAQVTTPKPSTTPLPRYEINKLRLSQVLRPSSRQQFKDVARNAITNGLSPLATDRSSNKLRNSRPRSNRRRPRPRRPRIDPDLMSDMMDMAGDFGMMGMFMNSMSGRGSRCDYSMAAMMEYMMSGRCGNGVFG